MAGGPPDNRSSSAFGPRVERGDISDRLCSHVLRPILFSDHHSGLRDMVPSSAGETLRQLQVVEGLLAPFFGKSAPRLARAIRVEFGSLGQAFQATDHDFAKLGKDGHDLRALLLAARRLVDGARNERTFSVRLDPSDSQLHNFLRGQLCSASVERLMVFFCDRQDRYIGHEVISWGTERFVELDMSSLFRRALSVGASSFLMAHNHPSGICTPSEDDIGATRQVAHLAQMLNLTVLDHLIVTAGECYSMRARALF